MDKNKPQVRFKEFDEDWEKSNFDTIFNSISNNSLSREKLNYHSGNAKNIHYGDILVKFNEIVDVDKEVIPFISDNKTVEKLKNSKLIDGDIIISDAAEDEMVGKCIELINVKDNIALSGLHTIAIRPKQKFAPRYLGYYMNSNSYHDQLLKLMQGTKVLSISKTAVKKTFVNHPKNDKEQSQIGNFFENLDKLLTEHQQRQSKLKELKKAMLSKMFPQQGQTVPEIRFKGFVVDWVEKPLYKIANNISDGNWIESNHIFEEGEYRIVQTGNLGIGMFLDKSNSAKYFQQKDFDEVRGNEIFPGDILISRLAEPAGRTIILPSTGFRMVTAVDVTIIRPNELSFDPTFLMTQLNSTNILNAISENVSGTSHRRISRKNLEKTKLITPNLDEQKAIGNYFKNLNHLITNRQVQIEKLQHIKKAFLNKMFI